MQAAVGFRLPPFVLFALLTVLLASCTVKYRPRSGPGVEVLDDTAVLMIDDLRVAVQKRSWLREPTGLNDYYTTFYVQIRNMNTTESRKVTPAEMSMLDQHNSQFDVVPVQEVGELLLDRDPYARYVGDLTLTPQERDERLRAQTESRANLNTYAFAFGDVLPGAVKSGYVFFNRLPSNSDVVKFIFRQREVRFERSKD